MKKINSVTLSVFDIFKDLSDDDRGEIARLMVSHEYSTGGFVISSNDENRRVYFIVSGAVRACAATAHGKQVYFDDLSPGMMFGEVAVIDGKKRTSDCVAITDSWILSLTDTNFLKLIDTYPAVSRAVLIRLASIVRYQLQRIYEFTSFSVNQRIRFELARLAANEPTNEFSNEPANEQSVVLNNVPTQLELAERVCAHREAVCRELKKLSKAGYITWARGEYVIHDLPGLMQHASER